MKRQVIAALVGSLIALPALADAGSQNSQQSYEWEYPTLPATASVSRADVLAQLVQAKQSGDVVVNAESGATANQIDPSAHPAQNVAAGVSRAEVLAQLKDAKREGNMVANAETGTLAKDL
jgi:hypothetical protein